MTPFIWGLIVGIAVTWVILGLCGLAVIFRHDHNWRKAHPGYVDPKE